MERGKRKVVRLALVLFMLFCINLGFNSDKAYAAWQGTYTYYISEGTHPYGMHIEFDAWHDSTLPYRYNVLYGYCQPNGTLVLNPSNIFRNLSVSRYNDHVAHVSFDFYPDWNALKAARWDGKYEPADIRITTGGWDGNKNNVWDIHLCVYNSAYWGNCGDGTCVLQYVKPDGNIDYSTRAAHDPSGWGWDGSNHRKYCLRCGAWTEAHNTWANWKWVTDASAHVRQCNIDGLTWDWGTHVYGDPYGNTATCTTGGLQYRSCGTCGYTISEGTSALGHSWGAEYYDTDGYAKQKCTRCGAIQVLHGIYYTIKYDGNGATSGTTENSSHEYGKVANLNTNGYSKTGFSFGGWNTQANGTGIHYEDEASVINLTTTHNNVVSLYAEWKINQYPVKYIIHDITTNTNIKTIMHDVNYDTVVSGLEIDSELNPTAEGVFYVDGDEKPYKLLTEDDNETLHTTAKVSTSGATVYRYCRLNEIDLVFDENTPSGASLYEPLDSHVKKVVPGKSYGELPTPKLSDWIFDGWFTEKIGGTKITSSSIVSKTQAFTIYAHWTPLSITSLSYNKSVSVVEDLGITEEKYLQTYGKIQTKFLKDGNLLYPYQTTTIEVDVDGKDSGGNRKWRWDIKRNGKWETLVAYDLLNANIGGINYTTRSDKNRSRIYLDITGAIRTNNNTEYRLYVKNNANNKTTESIPLTVYWLPDVKGNSATKQYTHTIQIRYENLDGSFTDYETVYSKRLFPNQVVSWSIPESVTYEETSVEYRTADKDVTSKIDIKRQMYYLDVNGCINGNIRGNIKGYGTCDVYINGELVAKQVTDYYKKAKYGSTYEIKNITANDGHAFKGFYIDNNNNGASGIIGDKLHGGKPKNTAVALMFD